MNNKLIAVILALLVVIAGGAAYYSYTLNQRLEGLDRALSDYRTEEAGRIACGDGTGKLFCDPIRACVAV